MGITRVFIAKKAEKQVQKLPIHIIEKLYSWIEQVETYGVYEVRIIPGYHDESLKGSRQGQRSIRLSRSYRAIYLERESNHSMEIVIVEVNKHDY